MIPMTMEDKSINAGSILKATINIKESMSIAKDKMFFFSSPAIEINTENTRAATEALTAIKADFTISLSENVYKKAEKIRMIKKAGIITPVSPNISPAKPFNLYETSPTVFIATGPGIVCAIVTVSAKDEWVSHFLLLQSSCLRMGSIA